MIKPATYDGVGHAGIIAYEGRRPLPRPRLHPFMWGVDPKEGERIGSKRNGHRWGALIVGPRGSLPKSRILQEVLDDR